MPTRMAPAETASGTVQSTEIGLVHQCAVCGPSGLEDREPAVERLADQEITKSDPLQHQHRGVGQAHAALDQPAAGVDPAEAGAKGMIASGFCRARNATRMPV